MPHPRQKLSCYHCLSAGSLRHDGLMADRTAFGKFMPTGFHGFGTTGLTESGTFEEGGKWATGKSVGFNSNDTQ